MCSLNPGYLRNGFVGEEYWSRFVTGGRIAGLSHLTSGGSI